LEGRAGRCGYFHTFLLSLLLPSFCGFESLKKLDRLDLTTGAPGVKKEALNIAEMSRRDWGSSTLTPTATLDVSNLVTFFMQYQVSQKAL